MPCVVILTALPVEYLAVRTYLTELHEEIHPKGTIYERGWFTSTSQIWDVGIVEIGAGNTGAAIEAERAIAYFSPDVLFFVGVAGGIKDVEIGDVVASTKIYGYESGKAEQRFKPRPEIGLPAYGLEQRARAEARKGDWLQRLTTVIEPTPRVFVAPIAAGEKVVASTKSDVFQFLAENYGDVIAVEMEGLGFLEAAWANQRVEAIVIRGISDLIDGKGNADKSGSQGMASRHASAFAFTMLANLKLSDEGRREVVAAVVQGGTAYIQSDRQQQEGKVTSEVSTEEARAQLYLTSLSEFNYSVRNFMAGSIRSHVIFTSIFGTISKVEDETVHVNNKAVDSIKELKQKIWVDLSDDHCKIVVLTDFHLESKKGHKVFVLQGITKGRYESPVAVYDYNLRKCFHGSSNSYLLARKSVIIEELRFLIIFTLGAIFLTAIILILWNNWGFILIIFFFLFPVWKMLRSLLFSDLNEKFIDHVDTILKDFQS
jgi:nucleoside phosphorylase